MPEGSDVPAGTALKFSAGRGAEPGTVVDRPRPRGVLGAFCVTEITSWGVLYYAFPVLAPAIQADTGWSASITAAAFSAALVVAAVAGIPMGRVLDRRGPRAAMTAGSVLASLATVGVAAAPNLAWFTVAWLLVGVAMSAVLYQPAFVALTRWYGGRHVSALTTVTLVAGLASTVFAPLTAVLSTHLSWRGVYLVLAVILAVVTIPLHALALRRPWPAAPPAPPTGHHAGHARSVIRSRPFLLLVAALTTASLAMFATMIGLVPLLTERGATATAAAWALGLGGVGQVVGRLGYGILVRATSVRTRTVWILGVAAVTTIALAVVPGPVWLLVVIAVVAGTARGIATLLQATAISDRWGTTAYGTLSGILAAPVTAASALAPWAGAALAGPLGGYPQTFAALGVVAVLAIVLAAGSVPGPSSQPATRAPSTVRSPSAVRPGTPGRRRRGGWRARRPRRPSG
ncbi:Predicted arabinose efflux permease, MFS family [Micromonospora phaseoli]|uniref:Predicted arabinose efflux permease, MFS family n=1 Tax=Micromonospora phaseoli TaxID=1144548 RepID=A0A1H6UMZ4_9ACTN|nr:MFS transporter [Micromonospora phaseoli]PZV99080.1 putative MFS family arabinose efflux permease [Micromonospora phaseoli]GIJ78718.1 MFS transporter [Micromonospora phaseoli]SEI93723.1 Predicted arabinose efflux permease, MFS family [Micromonospora phaseoli]